MVGNLNFLIPRRIVRNRLDIRRIWRGDSKPPNIRENDHIDALFSA